MNTTEGLDVTERFKLWLEWKDSNRKVEWRYGKDKWTPSILKAFDPDHDYRLAEPEKPRVITICERGQAQCDYGWPAGHYVLMTDTPHIVQAGREPIRLEEGWVVLRKVPLWIEYHLTNDETWIDYITSLRVNFDE